MDVVTIDGACAMFSITRSTYYRQVREGLFPRPRRIAGRWAYTQAELDAYVLLAGRWHPGPFEAGTKEKDDKTP